MADELQGLLDRIQQEGVARAEAEAAQIVATAREQAARVTAEAETAARARVEQAERDAQAFQDRAVRALEQAARDILLSVGAALDRLFGELARREAAAVLTPELVADLMRVMTERYAASAEARDGMTLLVPPEHEAGIAVLLRARLGDALSKGVTVAPEGSLKAGFKLALDHGRIQHDFTAPAIAEAIARVVRPHLAEIVRRALGQDAAKPA